MIYIFDRNENLLEIITEYENRESITKLNSERTLSFSCKKNKNIRKYNKAGYFENDKFQLFIIDDFTEFKDLNEDTVEVECIHDFYSLSNTLIDDKRAKNITEAITKALENSSYKVGIVENFENRDINFYHISRLKALNEIIKTYKCEFDVRIEIDQATGKIKNKFIDLKHRLGSDTGLRFTYDTALESVEKSVITEGHFNVLWGWGKSLETENGGYSRKLDFSDINNGKKYVEDIESIEKYGRLEGIFEDSSIEDKGILLKVTSDKLETTKDLKISYKATVKDISKLVGYEHFKVNLGDTIIILDEELNEIIEARIISIEQQAETILILGNYHLALSDEDLEDVLGDLNDKIENIPKPEIPDIDTIYPDILPAIPVVEAKGLFSSVILTWTYENKNYYTYEVFSSQLKDFYPSDDNRIFTGKASSFLHEVKPAETWYYRIRVKNTYDKVTDFSTQVEATTKKIADGTQYFEELAIGHALIASLDLDKATVGKLKGQFIEAYNLVVVDGNGNETLKIDSFGHVVFHDGITHFDKEGVKVSMADGEGQQGYSRMAHDGFEIFDNKNIRKAHFGQDDSAYIQRLKCNNIENEYLIKKAKNIPNDFFVSVNGTGDGTGRDVNNKSNSVNSVLVYIEQKYGRYLNWQNINIWIDPGNYTENIRIIGWLGVGNINIYMNDGTTFFGYHHILENTTPVFFRGSPNFNTWGNVGAKFYLRGSDTVFRVRNSNCTIYAIRGIKEGFNTSYANWNGYTNVFAYYEFGATGYAYNCDVVGFNNLVRAHQGSVVGAMNNKGHCKFFAYASQGSLINVQGYISQCQNIAAEDNAGWVKLISGTTTNSTWYPKQEKPADPVPPPPPPPPSFIWVESTFSASNLRTVTEGSGSSTSNRIGQWGQGYWGSYQAHRGYADLGNNPSSWCSGGRNFTGWITLRRITSGGYNGEVPKPQIKRPNGTFWDCGVAFAHGQTKTIQLPSDITSAIANGSMKQLEMWAGRNQNQYAFFDMTSIKIKCEKPT
ncbi:MAG: phage tail spike protein [Sarcina sp.]